MNRSDLGALFPFSEALRVVMVFKKGTFALTVLSHVVLLLSGGQCYGKAWSCTPSCPRAVVTIAAVSVTRARWALAAYVQSEGTLQGL